jgi:carnitine-CoA ligase
VLCPAQLPGAFDPMAANDLIGINSIASVAIERVLNDHPAVDESGVIPVPAALSEDEMHAYVVLRPGTQTTAEALQAWCAARLACFKMPHSVRFRDALPTTPTQRVEKYKLREEYARGV